MGEGDPGGQYQAVLTRGLCCSAGALGAMGWTGTITATVTIVEFLPDGWEGAVTGSLHARATAFGDDGRTNWPMPKPAT
jgi:hypothetical protein